MALLGQSESTTLTEPETFYHLFQACEQLSDAGDLLLPATTLSDGCYREMFKNCRILSVAPKLPATTLETNCYRAMFYCNPSTPNTSLKTAPDLPAAILKSGSYQLMFNYCQNLNYIKCLATDISATDCTTKWVNGVQTNSGTFIKNASMISWTIGINGIPTNWVVQNDEEESGTTEPDYTIHYSTYMAQSEILRIPNSLEITKFDGRNTNTNQWTYHDGIVLKSIINTYDEYNTDGYDLNDFFTYVNHYYNTMITGSTAIPSIIKNSQFNATALDDMEPGVALLSLYTDKTDVTKYKTCLDMIYQCLSGVSKDVNGIYWHKSNYQNQGWLDGIYMVQPFRTAYAKKFLTGTEQTDVYDDVCYQINKMAELTYDSSCGLYRHAFDSSKTALWIDPNSSNEMQSYYVWGRSIGWYMMAIVDVLEILPQNHTGRTSLINILTGICTNLKTYADSTTGVWRNLPTEAAAPNNGNENGFESSSSSMFAYAWIKGVRLGYLPMSEKQYALQVFNNVVNTFITESDGKLSISNVAQIGNPGNNYSNGTQLSTKEDVFNNYCLLPFMTNNSHGVAPFIYAAIEYDKLTA
jgi:unsaturated rhamnogalacturonyl hydrolase